MVAMSTAAAGSAIFDSIEDAGLLREYDDGADWRAESLAKERAFRQGFVEEARRVVRVWAHPPGPPPPPDTKPVSLRELMAKRRFDPDVEIEAALKLRRRVRERYTVYGRGDAGRKTHVLGYRQGHDVAAARVRGRHHALVYVMEPWFNLETSDVDIFDPRLLCPWLRAVEAWASRPIRRGKVILPPPRPLEVVPMEALDDDFLLRTARSEPPLETITSEPPSLVNCTSEPASSLKTVISEPPSLMQSMSEPAPSLGKVPSEPPPRLRLTRADQIEMRPPHWLLRGMLERDTLALIFGDPGCGKSFLAIDWACRVATGTPWRGQAVKAAPVVYVAGEGQQGFGRRIRAWTEHHGVSLANVPLYLAPAVAIPLPTDLVALIVAIDTGVANVGQPGLIVLDTLARCFGGGDENSTQDMSKFVIACDVIRRRYGCTILVVHHAGHGDKTRARGAIALKAALDAEYRLANDAGMLLTATKMKDAETPPPLALQLVTVDLPGLMDDYGNPVTSAAIEVVDADTSAIEAQVKSLRPRGRWQEVGLAIARSLISRGDDGQVAVEAWREACQRAGMVRQNQHRVLDALTTHGDLIVTDGQMSLPTP
jgi:hypothetical protein